MQIMWRFTHFTTPLLDGGDEKCRRALTASTANDCILLLIDDHCCTFLLVHVNRLHFFLSVDVPKWEVFFFDHHLWSIFWNKHHLQPSILSSVLIGVISIRLSRELIYNHLYFKIMKFCWFKKISIDRLHFSSLSTLTECNFLLVYVDRLHFSTGQPLLTALFLPVEVDRLCFPSKIGALFITLTSTPYFYEQHWNDLECSEFPLILPTTRIFHNNIFVSKFYQIVPYPCQTSSNHIDKITLFTVHLS